MQLKPSLLALAAAACLASPAHAIIFTVTGNTTGAPTFNRPLEDLSGLSAVGTAVRYNVLNFSVSVAGDYTFLTTAAFDPFVFLYSPSFSAASALTNAKIGNDDLLGLTTSGFTFTLATGVNYAYVATGFSNTDFGNFSTTIGGPGVVNVVPEPQAYALMLLGLCAVGLARRRALAETA